METSTIPKSKSTLRRLAKPFRPDSSYASTSSLTCCQNLPHSPCLACTGAACLGAAGRAGELPGRSVLPGLSLWPVGRFCATQAHSQVQFQVL